MSGAFKVVLADPPWRYATYSPKSGRRIECHYPTMAIEDIIAMPVGEVVTRNAALFLWCTWPMLSTALRVMAAWGFDYKSGLPWIKRRGERLQIGTGFRFRAVSEVLLLGIRGNVRAPDGTARFPGIIQASRGKHSSKPQEQYAFAEQYEGPWLELFGRPGLFIRPGWTVLGNEVDGHDIRCSLLQVARELEGT